MLMLEDRAPSPCFDDGDLSKDFGLDITVSDGGLVTSAANQRQYQAECSRIYQQFILNMGDYINEEAQLRKTLSMLQSQQKKPSGKRSAGKHLPPQAPKTPDMPDEDAFTSAQLEEFRNILSRDSCRSRLSHAGSFAAADSTKQDGQGKSLSSLVNQPPVTHMFPALKERPPSVKAQQLRRDSKSGVSNVDVEKKNGDLLNASNTEDYDGIMEHNADLSNNRRIRMNPRAFTKLMSGQVKVKLLNKCGDFVLTPLTSDTAVLAQEEQEKQQMDNRERVALVRQRTTFQSPTLSSDLKINNLVAIQKALKGQNSKRVTVGEVMRSARDRRSRLFRVQMSGNRFDEFDQQIEDIGYVHEVKAANDLGDEDVPDARPRSRARNAQMNMMRQRDPMRPESRLRAPTPIPLHILDPKSDQSTHYSRTNTPAIVENNPMDFSGLIAHRDCSDFEHRYSQAVDTFKPKREKDKQHHVSVIHLGLDEIDSGGCTMRTASRNTTASKHGTGRAITGIFPVSKNACMRSKSAVSMRTAGLHTKRSEPETGRSKTPHTESPPSPPIKRINNMRDTAYIVKRWQEEDRAREDKLNRWRMRMNFAATRRGNVGRAKSGR